MSHYDLKLSTDKKHLVYTYDIKDLDHTEKNVQNFLDGLKVNGVHYQDLNTKQSSLEEIFVQLLKK